VSAPERKGASAAETESVPQRAWLAAGAAWLVPGLGHLLLGRRARALLFAILVFGSLAIGIWLHGPLLFFEGGIIGTLVTLASMGVGLPYFALRLTDYQGEALAIGFEYGKAFIATAGLMNLLLVLDAWDIACGRKE
jgi:hypothetical protein